MHEVLQAFFDLRSAGREVGAVTESGAGSWGLLRLVDEGGPVTMAEVARSRGVTRQYIQKLANELIGSGYLQLVDNPKHRRSGLLTLTPAGRRHLERMSESVRTELQQRCGDLDPSAVAGAVATLAQFRRCLARASGVTSD